MITKLVREHINNNPSITTNTDISSKREIEETMATALTNVVEVKETNKSTTNDDKVAVTTKYYENECKEPTIISARRHSKEKAALPTDINPWTLMESFKIIEAEESKAAQKSKAVQKRQEMASALNDQIRRNEETSRLEKAEDENFLEIQRKSLEQWKKEQEAVIQKEEQKILQLRKVRQEQVEESKRRRKAELHEARSRELKEIEDLKCTLENEEDRKRTKKERERQRWGLIKEENAKEVVERKLQKIREAEMDAKLMADMKVRYDIEEKRKAKALGKKTGRAEENSKKLFEVVAFKKREEMIEFEKKLLEQAKVREQAQAAEETRRQEALQKKKRDITESNRKMAEEKSRRERNIEKEKETYSLQFLRDQEALLEEKEAFRAKQNETKQKYRQNLHNQIEEKSSLQADSDGMTSVERSINKKVSTKVLSNFFGVFFHCTGKFLILSFII